MHKEATRGKEKGGRAALPCQASGPTISCGSGPRQKPHRGRRRGPHPRRYYGVPRRAPFQWRRRVRAWLPPLRFGFSWGYPFGTDPSSPQPGPESSAHRWTGHSTFKRGFLTGSEGDARPRASGFWGRAGRPARPGSSNGSFAVHGRAGRPSLPQSSCALAKCLRTFCTCP